jgi:hypothetical protein
MARIFSRHICWNPQTSYGLASLISAFPKNRREVAGRFLQWFHAPREANRLGRRSVRSDAIRPGMGSLARVRSYRQHERVLTESASNCICLRIIAAVLSRDLRTQVWHADLACPEYWA